MAKQLFVTPYRCINCGNCEIACSFIHTRDPMKPAIPRIRTFAFKGDIYSVALCQQCEERVCQEVCPTGALTVDPETGAINRTDACILCRTCVLTCPYGNIHFDPLNKEIVKCDLCAGDPFCVKYCPSLALVWAEEPVPDLEPEVEVEGLLNEEEARYSANRCLDCGGCAECHECIAACPADAIKLDMRDEEQTVDVDAVIISTGFNLFDAHLKPTYGYGRYPNVITGMQMDRLLSPTRPFNHVIRPSDGKRPDNIAYVLCTGSRDLKVNNQLCSRVCCMYTIKQAQLIMGALPLADITIYYIDIRAFGKGYDEFAEQAKAMGVYFVKGKVAEIKAAENDNLTLYYEDIASGEGLKDAEHDLVILSVGLLPNTDALNMFKEGQLEADLYLYIKEVDEDINPGKTSIDGVFAAGAASAARDIPDSILHAGAAAAQAAAYIESMRAGK